MSKETASVFRGTWQPTIHKPFGAYSFLPTPPPQEPKKKVQQQQQEAAAAPPPQPAAPEPERERMRGPPPGIQVAFTVLDREKEYRSCIATDGTCIDNYGQVFGYLNFDSLEAGSVSENYLGNIVESQFNNVAQVRDEEDDLVGYLDMGTRSVKDRQNATVVDFESGGRLKHPNGTYLGEFEGAKGFHNMRELALYLVLLDPGMCSDVSG